MSALVALGATALVLSIAVAVPRVRGDRARDSLTGLGERAQLHDAIGATLRGRQDGDPVAVVCVGLDRFSNVNGALGRDAGNEVLRRVADRLGDLGGVAARLGGDEFAVLAVGRDAAGIGERVGATFTRPVEVAGRSVFLGASVGVVCLTDAEADAETLLQHADTAMQLAKERGGGTVVHYSDGLHTEVADRLALASALQRALERDEFVLHYQPIVDTVSGAIVGMEALVRWAHPTLGLIAPDRFIGVAEDTGLIVPLGEWVLDQACMQAQRWQSVTPLRLAINLSARQFEHQRIDDVVAGALRRSGLDPRRLDVELTERAVLHDESAVAETLRSLQAMGVGCSVDDFGTGYGGLTYLIRFPVDELKIDRSFVSEIGGTGGHAVIVAGVIGLARALGLRVVAEGVETSEQARFLESHGCDRFQGYLVSEAVPAARFEELLVNGASRRCTPAAVRPIPAAAARPTADQLWETSARAAEPVPAAGPRTSSVRPGPRQASRRRRPLVALAVVGVTMTTAGTAAAVPGPAHDAAIAFVSVVHDLLPGAGPSAPADPASRRTPASGPDALDGGPGASGASEGRSDEAPGHTGELPSRRAEAPGQGGDPAGEHGPSGQSGQSGVAPGQAGTQPGQADPPSTGDSGQGSDHRPDDPAAGGNGQAGSGRP